MRALIETPAAPRRSGPALRCRTRGSSGPAAGLLLAALLASPLAGAWDVTGRISAPGVAQDDVQMAGNAGGDAVAVWTQWAPALGDYALWASRHRRDAGWQAAEVLASERAGSPAVAVDASGHAVVVWRDSGDGSVRSRRWIPASGWTAETVLDAGGVNADPQVATSPGGEAVATWRRLVGNTGSILASRLQAGTWTAPAALEPGAGDARLPRAAAGANGDVAVAWIQADGAEYRVHVAHAAAAGGWQPDAAIAAQPTGSAGAPDLALDASGRVRVVWTHRPPGGSTAADAWAADFDPASGWDAPVALESIAGDARGLRIAMQPDGRSVAVWRQRVADGQQQVHAVTRGAATAWSAPQRLDRDPFEHAFDPRVSINAAGRAVAVWEQAGAVQSARWHPLRGWSPAEPAGADPDGLALYPQVLLPDDRGPLVAWHRGAEAEVAGLQQTIWSSVDNRLFSDGLEGPP